MQCHSSSPDDPESAPRTCDSEAALKNPVEGQPALVNRHHLRECLRITCSCALGRIRCLRH